MTKGHTTKRGEKKRRGKLRTYKQKANSWGKQDTGEKNLTGQRKQNSTQHTEVEGQSV